MGKYQIIFVHNNLLRREKMLSPGESSSRKSTVSPSNLRAMLSKAVAAKEGVSANTKGSPRLVETITR